MPEMKSLHEAMESMRMSPKLMIGGVHMKVEIDELDEYHEAKAERELRETPELAEESLKIICDMLAEEEELFVPMDREFLQKFLRPCKWYPRSAFKLIRRHYEYKRGHPEFFDNLSPSTERAVLVSGMIKPLPRRTADGQRLLLVELGHKWNPKEVTLDQLFRGLLLFIEIANIEPRTQISGAQVIVDVQGISLGQVSYFTPKYAKAIIEFLQRALPNRLKGVHIVNQSFVFNMAFALFKPFLRGKLQERLHFHGQNWSSLLTHIDAKALPTKYGGEFDMEEEKIGQPLCDYALHFENYFHDLNKYGYISDDPWKK